MEDSSERLFFKIVNTIYDNSTGDMNYIPFSFIDKMRLNKLFEEYLINESKFEYCRCKWHDYKKL